MLHNATVAEGHIASYQYKDPFGALEMSPEGAFLQPWWAMLGALRTGTSVPLFRKLRCHHLVEE
jgi:hypothetical protein